MRTTILIAWLLILSHTANAACDVKPVMTNAEIAECRNNPLKPRPPESHDDDLGSLYLPTQPVDQNNAPRTYSQHNYSTEQTTNSPAADNTATKAQIPTQQYNPTPTPQYNPAPTHSDGDEIFDKMVKGLISGIALALLIGLVTYVWVFVTHVWASAGDLFQAAKPVVSEIATVTATLISETATDFANRNKQCPFCAETIKQQATVCKHCMRDLA